MPKLKKEEKTITLKASTPWKLMNAYVWCMIFGDMLNLLMLRISDHNQNQKHMDVIDGMDGPLV
jgi:hypothetical protein